MNRVHPLESIQDSMDRIPFLRRFLRGNYTNEICGDKINKYMGYHLVGPMMAMTSNSINKVLEEAERRGHLK